MTAPAIRCRGICVTLGGAQVLDRVDLDVAAGEWVSVVGPNGAGKSTLLRVIAGLLESAGTVALGGRSAAGLRGRERARRIALVPQDPVVPVGVSVADYVLLGRTPHLRGLAVEGRADIAAVRDALSYLDLLHLGRRLVTTLSGGERQRVLIARALAQQAPIVLLDEPTTALDLGHQQQVLELIDRLRADHGLTVLSTMHDLTLAGQYAERLVLMDAGRVVVQGPGTQVLTPDNLARYYGARVRVVQAGGRPVVLPVRAQVVASTPSSSSRTTSSSGSVP